MTDAPKPTLTEAEREELNDWEQIARELSAESVTPYVARIIAAREAAARREALLEAREDIRARRQNFRRLNADPQYLAAMDDAFGLVNNRLRNATRALAEPERDEEGR